MFINMHFCVFDVLVGVARPASIVSSEVLERREEIRCPFSSS
jgi:hypothetical protein